MAYDIPHEARFAYSWPAQHARKKSGVSIVLLIPLLSIFIMIEAALMKTTFQYVFQKSSAGVTAPALPQDFQLYLNGP